MKDKTVLELTEEEAVSFLGWRKNQENWDILQRAGVFTITNGSAELHFNGLGQLASVDTHLKAFRRITIHTQTFDKKPIDPIV